MNDENPVQPLTQMVKEASEFLGKVVGPPLKELGLLLEDNVKLWRFKNQVKIINKAKSFLNEKGIQPRKVPLKTLFPLLEHMSLEEDPVMQDKWAALLANAANPTLGNKIHPGYVDILNQLTPKEVALLDFLYEEHQTGPPDQWKYSGYEKSFILKNIEIPDDMYNVIINNLYRLGLLQPPSSGEGTGVGSYPIALRSFDFVAFTPLGLHFIEQCR